MNIELLSVVNNLEHDRKISRELIIRAIETALETVTLRALNADPGEIHVEIDRKNLKIKAFRKVLITDDPANPALKPLIYRARKLHPEALPGETVDVPIEPASIGRIGAQNARQMILQNIKQAERENVVAVFRDRLHEMVTGVVRQIGRRGDLIVEIEGSDAVLPYRELLPHDEFDVGDEVRAVIHKVQDLDPSQLSNGPAVTLSRTSNEFLRALFVREVSEIADGTVEIMGIARDPGSRAKLAVRSHDDKVDPVGSCVGVRGARVRNVVNELEGEKVDIVRWSDDIRQYAAQALSPARLVSVEVLSEDPLRLVAIADPEQVKLALGRRHQNVSLARKLIGCSIDIRSTEAESSFETRLADLIESLSAIGISREEAQVLAQNGYTSVEGIAEADAADIVADTGLSDDAVARIWKIAAAYTLNPGANR